MDDRQFDTLVKWLSQTRVSRLVALRALAASALPGLAAIALPATDSDAKRKRKSKANRNRKRKSQRKKNSKDFHRLGKPCDKGQPCGKYTECRSGFCAPTKCLIEGKVVDHNVKHPEKPCLRCRALEHNDAWKRWSSLPDGTTCPPGASDNPCLSTFIGTCQDGDCVAAPVSDGLECGDGRVCCRGTCCASGECCGEDGACLPCGPQCLIEGKPYPNGALQTPTGCLKCDPSRSETVWSPLDDRTPCGGVPDRECCNGTCCPPGQCCVGVTCQACACEDDGENRRKGRRNRAAAGDVCDPPCTIDGQEYPAGAPNPANPCEVCDSAQDPSAWSPAPFLTKCGANLDQVCCNGACCPDGECCRPGFAFCSVEWCGIVDPCPFIEGPCGCTIGGQFYAHQTVNPANECEWCDAYWSTDAWTGRPSHIRCGPFSDRFCCEGVCCETGSCCNSADVCEFSAPGCRGCTIGGRFYFNGHQNPDDPCQQCVTAESTTSWSHAPNGNTCEAVIDENGVYWGDRVCCEGVCCELYACCNLSGICEQTSPANCQ